MAVSFTRTWCNVRDAIQRRRLHARERLTEREVVYRVRHVKVNELRDVDVMDVMRVTLVRRAVTDACCHVYVALDLLQRMHGMVNEMQR